MTREGRGRRDWWRETWVDQENPFWGFWFTFDLPNQSLCVEANSSDLVRFRVGNGHGVSIYLDVPRAFRTKKEKKKE